MMCLLRSCLIDLKSYKTRRNYVLYMAHGEKKEEVLPLLTEEDKEKKRTNEPQKFDLKPLLVELKYAYLEENDQCPVVNSSLLNAS